MVPAVAKWLLSYLYSYDSQKQYQASHQPYNPLCHISFKHLFLKIHRNPLLVKIANWPLLSYTVTKSNTNQVNEPKSNKFV